MTTADLAKTQCLVNAEKVMQRAFWTHDKDSSTQCLTTTQSKRQVCLLGKPTKDTPFIVIHKPQVTKNFFVAGGNQLTYGIDKSSASRLLRSQSHRPDLPSAFPPLPAASATTTFASDTSSICHPAQSPKKEDHLAWAAFESTAMTVLERPHVPLEILRRRTRT
jgi:hypothetical protein